MFAEGSKEKLPSNKVSIFERCLDASACWNMKPLDLIYRANSAFIAVVQKEW